MQVRALQALDQFNSWLESAGLRMADVNVEKQSALEAASKRRGLGGGGPGSAFENLGRHGEISEVDWLLEVLKNDRFGYITAEYLRGLLSVKASAISTDALTGLAKIGDAKQYWTSTDGGVVYDSGTNAVSCSKIRDLAAAELKRRVGGAATS